MCGRHWSKFGAGYGLYGKLSTSDGSDGNVIEQVTVPRCRSHDTRAISAGVAGLRVRVSGEHQWQLVGRHGIAKVGQVVEMLNVLHWKVIRG